MKILLILPYDNTYRYRGAFSRTLSYAPLTLTTLAALVPDELNATIEIIDEGIQKSDYLENHYTVVGITCVTSAAPRAYELARVLRRRGSIVILGGAHATLNPEECVGHADAVVVGPAEVVWPRLLWSIQKGDGVHGVYRGKPEDARFSPVPARRYIRNHAYLNIPTVMASRGCSNSCAYCAINHMWEQKICSRPVVEVIDEIKKLRTRKVLFLDPNITADRDYALELFAALSKFSLEWAALTTVDTAFDQPLLDQMVRSGCIGVLSGFESCSSDVLRNYGKVSNDSAMYASAVSIFHRFGIRVLGTFMIGLLKDPKHEAESILDMIDISGVDIPRFSILTPLPGTVFFDRMKKANRLRTRDWSVYDTEHAVFDPEEADYTEVERQFRQLWKRAYSLDRIIKRSFRIRKNRIMTLGVNLSFRRYAMRTAANK